MYCEVDYCIYNQDSRCLLDKININSLEMCEECTIISLDIDFLAVEKERQLAVIEILVADPNEE